MTFPTLSGLRGNGRGIVLMVVAMMTLATMDAMSKLLTESVAIPEILCVRFWIFVIAIVAVLGPKRTLAALKTRRPVMQIGRSLLLMVEMAAFIVAFSLQPLAAVHSVAAVTPLIAVALAAIVLKETVGIHRWSAVAIGFVGVLLIIRPGTAVFDPVSLIPLAAAFLWAFYQILLRMVGLTDAAETTILYTALTGLVVFTAIAPFVWVAPTSREWMLLGAVGVMGAAGHSLLTMAMRATPAGVLQPFNYTMVIWATVMGYLVFGYIPDTLTFVGGAIVIAGGLYAIHRERRAALSARQVAEPEAAGPAESAAVIPR